MSDAAKNDRTLADLQPRLLNFFASRVPDRTTREELVARVNLRLVERLHGARGIDDLERFAFGVANNVLNEFWREKQRRQLTEATLSSTAENLGRELTASLETLPGSRKALLRALEECLGQLNEADRDLAIRCYGEGKSKDNREQLARELSLTRNTLDARIARIRSRVATCVERKLETPA